MFWARPRRTTPVIGVRLGGFDEAYYRWRYRDVAEADIDPLTHYLEHGWREGRDPSAYFSTRGYLEQNPDVAQAGVNPLVHFWENGLSEGRKGWER
ncbi:MAG: hypothetical protein COT28_21570 [Methylobacterium sp. CG08_land_8_20_14_0_20_71_15]|nr:MULTISPECIES: hypothetical protein [unclassified Methylobacterium]PIU08118.1 MAG: hypothetical protein COT56_02545 [Methylobacterium sp. CG09_land_8_20_14_0_10_71_15]PIU11139.1 MAG: hypothetical protein COT28_21570 [Methylobacterium sp. CG08_land_8_20_14_0_20_71_15]